jgi:hypothetical protein
MALEIRAAELHMSAMGLTRDAAKLMAIAEMATDEIMVDVLAKLLEEVAPKFKETAPGGSA